MCNFENFVNSIDRAIEEGRGLHVSLGTLLNLQNVFAQEPFRDAFEWLIQDAEANQKYVRKWPPPPSPNDKLRAAQRQEMERLKKEAAEAYARGLRHGKWRSY